MPLHPGADKKRGRERIVHCCEKLLARFVLTSTAFLLAPTTLPFQDAGSFEKELFGNGVAISVTVHDDSGAPISHPAIVNLFRGAIPCGRAETSNGNAMLVVNGIGDFTVVVSAPGFREAREYLSVHAEGRAQVDVYLKRLTKEQPAQGVSARPILAPKAKEALDKGLQALKSSNVREADKQISTAMKLAPGHPDVLYAEGILRMTQQDFVQAQIALEKATQVDPGHARAFAALGMALCDQGKYDSAIAPLVKSLQLDAAGTWETRWALGKSYYQIGQYAEALKMSQEALASSKDKEPQLHLLVAQALTAVGRYEDAAEILRGFLKDHAESKEAATARRWLNALATDGKIHSASN